MDLSSSSAAILAGLAGGALPMPDDSKNQELIMQFYNSLGKSMLDMKNGMEMDSHKAITNGIDKPPMFDNILYAQLTKNSASSTPSPTDSMNNNEMLNGIKAEDLSQHKHTNGSAHSDNGQSTTDRRTPTGELKVKTERTDGSPENNRNNDTSSPLDVADCKVGIMNVKNMLINDAEKVCSSLLSPSSTSNVREILDDFLYKANSEAPVNNNNVSHSKDNDNGVDSDDTENEGSANDNALQAVKHGEQFMKWLETCSIPNITAMQVMQFKTLLNSCRTSAKRTASQMQNGHNGVSPTADNDRARIRKRK